MICRPFFRTHKSQNFPSKALKIFFGVFFWAFVFFIHGCSNIKPNREVERTYGAISQELPSQSRLDTTLQQRMPTRVLPDKKKHRLKDQLQQAQDAKRWWLDINDPTLHQVIELGIKSALSIDIAFARLEQAKAQARLAGANRWPSINFNGSAGVTSPDLEYVPLEESSDRRVSTATANFIMNWQADIFGNLRHISRSAKSSLASVQFRLLDTQRILVSQISQSYYLLMGVFAQQELQRKSIERRQQNQARINQLLKRGYATKLDKTRTDSQLYEAQATLAQLEIQAVQIQNELAVLLGMDLLPLRHLLNRPRPLIDLPNIITLPSVSQLVVNRPDVRAAEWELRAVAHSVNASKAALYPSLGFTVTLGKGTGSNTVNTGSFPNLNSITGGVVTNLIAPILGRGRLLAAIDDSSARLKQAHIQYEATIRSLISQLDTSLMALDKNKRIYEQRVKSAQSAEEAAELSKQLFKSGELDYTSVILAESTLITEQTRAVLAKVDWIQAYLVYQADVAPGW